MKLRLGLGVVLLTLGGAACNHNVAASPQAKNDTAQAQAIVQGCISKGNVLTHQGRQAILGCIAPPGHKQQFMSCAQGKVGTDGVITKPERTKLYQDLAVCVENNR